MGLWDILILALVAGIVGLAGFYVFRAKKKGQKCIGCPYSNTCQKGGCQKV